MRPFISRFAFLAGLLLVLTGVGLNLEQSTTPTPAIVLIIAGQIVVFISLFFLLRKKKDDNIEEYPEPDPEDFKENDQDSYTIEEQENK